MKREIVVATALSVILSGCSPHAIESDVASELVSQSAASKISNWSVGFTREQLMHQSLEVAHNYFGSHASERAGEITYYFEDSVSDTRIEKAKSMTELTASIFSDYAPDSHIVIAGMTQAFMTEIILENDISIPDSSVVSICGIEMWEDNPSGCNWENIMWYGYGELPESEKNTFNAVGPHELFHSVQASLAGSTQKLGTLPHWLLEGSAEFMGYAITDYANYYLYKDLAHEDWHYLPNPAQGLRFWTRPLGMTVPPEGYAYGQIATEYIVANVGVEGLMDLFKDFGNTLDINESFINVLGMSLTKFYALFDIAYTQMMKQDTGDFRTFENRVCPERFDWNCEIDNYKGLEWWQLVSVPVELPAEAENVGHDFSITSPHDVWPFDERGCGELLVIHEFHNMPLAVSIQAAEQYGKGANVSTEWYVMNYNLDLNKNGVLCDAGDL